MKTERLGTFEEWYAWEMKQRDNKKTWHYPTELTFDYHKNDTRHGYHTFPNKAIYTARQSDPATYNRVGYSVPQRKDYKPVQWEERA